jgi:hypothetical protein
LPPSRRIKARASLEPHRVGARTYLDDPKRPAQLDTEAGSRRRFLNIAHVTPPASNQLLGTGSRVTFRQLRSGRNRLPIFVHKSCAKVMPTWPPCAPARLAHALPQSWAARPSWDDQAFGQQPELSPCACHLALHLSLQELSLPLQARTNAYSQPAQTSCHSRDSAQCPSVLHMPIKPFLLEQPDRCAIVCWS